MISQHRIRDIFRIVYVVSIIVGKTTIFAFISNSPQILSSRIVYQHTFRCRLPQHFLCHKHKVVTSMSRTPAQRANAHTICNDSSSSSSSSSLEAAATSGGVSTPPVIRWGIVGLGDVCAVKAGPAFYKANGSELVAVMRRTPGAATAWVENNLPPDVKLHCQGYDNLDTMLARKDGIDAVYIATPPGAHLEIAQKVAAAGIPAYIEKPVGRCGAETHQIAKLFEEKGLSLFTAYVSRAYERTATIRRLIGDEKVLGDQVTSIKYTLQGSAMVRGLDWTGGLPWRLDARQAGGGLVMDVGCHVVDRIDYLCGPIIHVSGEALNRRSVQTQDVEDYVHLRGEIGPSSWAAIASVGATVECTWDFSASSSVDELVISGPKGSLRMAAMSPSLPIFVLDADGNTVEEITFDTLPHAALPLIQTITDELRGMTSQGSSPSRGSNSVRTSAVLDAALDTYYGGRRQDAFWDRPSTWPGRLQSGKW